jgi:hypothetical protein
MLVAIRLAGCAAALILVAACSQDRGDIGLGPSCANGLDSAYRELNQAKVDGLSGSVNWGKAASLLSAAKVQQQFEEYENCVIKVRHARRYLSEIRG